MKKKLLILLSLIGLAPIRNIAQSFQWVTGEPLSPWVQWSSFAISDNSNNIITAGKCDDGVFIIKYNSSGNKIWEQHYLDDAAIVRGIACDSNDNIYAMIFYMNITIDSTYYYNQSSLRHIFIKYNPNGETAWLKLIKGLRALASKTDSQDNLLMNGSFTDTLILDNYTLITPPSTSSSVIAKFNSSGQCVLAIQDNGDQYPYPMHSDILDNMYQASEFTRDTFTIGYGVHQVTLYLVNGRSFTAKYNANGDLLWAKQFRRWSIAPDDYGNLYALQQDTADSFYSQLTKYDSVGNLLWKRTIIHPDDIYHINLKFHNDYLYLSGGFRNSITIGDSTYYDNFHTRMFIAKLDTTGQLLWFNSSGGAGNAGGKNLAFGPTNEIYVTGDIGEGTSTFDSYSYTTNLGIFLNDITGLQNPGSIPGSISIFPNPFHSTFYLTSSFHEPININIYSSTGQHILSQKINETANTIHQITLNAPPGIYYLKAETHNQTFIKKLIVY
jgi:hypothetical protein